MNLRSTWCLALTAAIHAAAAQSQGRSDVTGSVADHSSGAPIAGAEIAVRGTNLNARSDDKGQFTIAGVAAGAHFVLARRPGFAPESIWVDLPDTTRLHFALRAVAVQTLAEVEVTGASGVPPHLLGFEDRRKGRNGGHFITRADIERRRSKSISDLLRGVQGIRMLDSMGTMVAVASRAPKVSLTSRQVVVNCPIRIGIDGALKEAGFPIDLVSTQDVYGIEVYSGAATIPTEFNSGRRDSYCGLIMIWTRTY